MNSKQRVLNILNRKPVDRIPIDIWYTPEVLESLEKYTGTKNEVEIWKKLGVDKIAWVAPAYKFDDSGATAAVVGAQKSKRTVWGVPVKYIKSGLATYEEFENFPLAAYEKPSEIDNYELWPDPSKFVYDDAVESARTLTKDFAILGPWVSFFEVYCQLRGIENALMDLAANPEFVEATLDRIEAIQTEMLKRLYDKAAKYFDMMFISDDVGTQNGLMMSPSMWEQYLQPRLKRWCDLGHSYGLKVFYHSDGVVEPIINGLIDSGVDILNPIQHVCPGMDMPGLKKKYGDRIVFHGGVDTQKVLPFGTVKDVVNETKDCLNTLGGGKQGFLCCSCHNIQAGTPIENIIAMIDTVKNS